ncbi:major capsid protein [Microvirus mar36]|uniref:Major capsid protein n=1 Tax=Microvirus mar36 TaxID=2851170 RepID=A0A8F5MJP0_9VIRU|nr:major capsid protein [Microvirus mar36]
MAKTSVLENLIPPRDYHDLSQSVYGSMTWGLLYPVYSRFFNAGDVVRIQPSIVLRTSPTIAPLFNRVDVRLHRFWCPRRLYHKAQRENSRSFDYTEAAKHVFPIGVARPSSTGAPGRNIPGVGGLLDWLNLSPAYAETYSDSGSTFWLNAEPAIAYLDIVRNYYSFSKQNVFSYMSHDEGSSTYEQMYTTVDSLDYFVESVYNSSQPVAVGTLSYPGHLSLAWPMGTGSLWVTASNHLGCLAVAPSSPDGLSRFIPNVSSDAIALPSTIPSLAVASRVQSIKDILAAAGTRFTDYLYAFFKTSIPHSDIPSLLYSGHLDLNTGVLFNASGDSVSASIGGGSLGSFVGTNTASGQLSSRRYKFDEPGYLIDIVSIRPVYAWAGSIPYWNIDLSGNYAFLPKLNRIGYRATNTLEYGFASFDTQNNREPTYTKVPFWHEFRSSVDQIHGSLRFVPFKTAQNVESYWVNQRDPRDLVVPESSQVYSERYLYHDMATINSIFPVTSFDVDNTYFSAYYKVGLSSYVSKQFATDLSSR